MNQTLFPDDTITPAPASAPAPKVFPPAARKAAAVFAAVAGLSAAGFMVVGSSHTPGQSAGAVHACETQVRSQLTAPSTARFATPTVAETGDTVNVWSSVDAQNAFGVPIRSAFTCVATWQPGGYWTAIPTLS